jgi:hypothetical protein
VSGQRAASILRGGGETRVVRRLGAVSRVVASRRERRGSRPVPGHRAKSRREARKGADGGSHARGREIRRGGERIREPTRGRARTETSPSPRRRSSARTWPPSRPALAVPLGRVPRAVASDDSPCRERRRDWNRKGHEIVSNVPFSSATGGETRRGIRARPRRVLGLDDDDVNPTCIDTIHRSLKVKVHLPRARQSAFTSYAKGTFVCDDRLQREERFFFASRKDVRPPTAHAATPPPSLRRPFRSSFRNDTKSNAYF